MAAEVFSELLSPCQKCGRVHVAFQVDTARDTTLYMRRAVETLTPQEYEVFVRMSGGLSNRKLADLLFVTEYTIKAPMGKIRRKLAAATRDQIVLASNVYNAWSCALGPTTDEGDERSNSAV